MLRIDWISFITLVFSITRVIYVLLIVDYFTRFPYTKSNLKYVADKVINIYKTLIFLMFGYSKAVYFNNSSYFINQKT